MRVKDSRMPEAVRECSACHNMMPDSKLKKKGRGYICRNQEGCAKRRGIRARADLKDGTFRERERMEEIRMRQDLIDRATRRRIIRDR